MTNYIDVLNIDGSVAWLFNCAVCSGFIMSGVFTLVTYIAVESGLDTRFALEHLVFYYCLVPEVSPIDRCVRLSTDYSSSSVHCGAN